MRCLLIMILMVLRAGCAAAADLQVSNTDQAGGPTYFIYVSPLGNDFNLGSRQEPVRTLTRADELLIQERPRRLVVVRVRSDEGEFLNQSVYWRYTDPEHETIIESYPSDRNAVFRADCLNPPFTHFFKLRSSAGRPTNIVLRRLTVSGYASRAIYIIGEREDKPGGWNGNNRIENCVFENIGNMRLPDRFIVYGALTLVNSRGNLISGCLFRNIANANKNSFPQELLAADGEPGRDPREKDMLGAGPDLPIIAIYLAHHSSDNVIIGNRFEYVRGDAVRIRDDSNDNLVMGNEFYKTGWSGVTTLWYCISGCTKLSAELPSCGNILLNNVMQGNWMCRLPRPVFYFYPDYSGKCGAAPMVLESDNEITLCYE